MENNKLKIIGIVAVIFALFLTIFIGFEDNNAGEYQINQTLDGDLYVRSQPGVYWSGIFTKTTTYENNGDVVLSDEPDDAIDGYKRGAEEVSFPNGSAKVNFVGQYTVPLDDSVRINLHIRYQSNENLRYMISQQIIEAIKNTGTLMSSEEAYSSKRAEFVRLAREQALYGLYKAKVRYETRQVAGDSKNELSFYEVDFDKNGKPIITKVSMLGKLNISLDQFNVKGMTFDDKTISLIDSRKNMQKAQQDAETAKAQGEALIAKEKATQEIEKIKQVTIAQKEKEVAVLDASRQFEVAKLQALEAEQIAKKTVTEGRADAERNRLKVAAGLTPQERAEWDYKKTVGVAEWLSKVKFPEHLIISGGAAGGKGTDPFDAVGLRSLYKLSEEMSNTK